MNGNCYVCGAESGSLNCDSVNDLRDGFGNVWFASPNNDALMCGECAETRDLNEYWRIALIGAEYNQAKIDWLDWNQAYPLVEDRDGKIVIVDIVAADELPEREFALVDICDGKIVRHSLACEAAIRIEK